MTDLFRFQKELRSKRYAHVIKGELTIDKTYCLEGCNVLVRDKDEIRTYLFEDSGAAAGEGEVVKVKKAVKERVADGSDNE